MKTAVEKFIEQLEAQGESWENVSIGRIQISIKVEDYLKLIDQAKEMEKQQIVKAVDAVQIVHRKYFENGWTGEDILGKEVPTTKDRTYFGLSKNGEQYYNETFKKQEQ